MQPVVDALGHLGNGAFGKAETAVEVGCGNLIAFRVKDDETDVAVFNTDMLRIRVNKAAGAGQRRRRVRVSRTLVVNGVNLRFQNAGKLVQLRLQRGQGNVADFDEPLNFAAGNLVGNVDAVNINSGNAAAGIGSCRAGLGNRVVAQLVNVAVKQRYAVFGLDDHFAVFAFEIIDVNQTAEVAQGRISLVFQIGNAVIAQDLIFDDFVVQGFQFVQQVVDLVDVFLDAHVSIAAEFLYFFRKVVQA